VTTGTLAESRHHREAPAPGTIFTGTLGLLRLYLRRDRIVLPLWVLLLSVPLGPVYMSSVRD
jgi:ABC-2 type transport system permease protein